MSKVFSGWILDSSGLFQVAALCLAIGGIFAIESVHFLLDNPRVRDFWYSRSRFLRWSGYISLIVLVLLFGQFTEVAFIYFQF
jgi:hypothetical protein